MFRPVTLLLALGASLIAQGLPNPVLRRAQPQPVYVGAPGWLDSFGRIVVTLYGENLAPDDTLSHPAGPDGGYQHIVVRAVSPDGRSATPWVPATAANGAQVLGACDKSGFQLGLDPKRYLGQPGSHLQVKLWVSLGATSAAEPSASTAQASAWSPVYTVDAAPAGATPPAPAAQPAPKAPKLTRISPESLLLADPKTTWKLKVYGTDIGGTDNRVVFNGDAGGAVVQEARTRYYDDDNSLLKGGEGLFTVTLPERYRKVGTCTVTVQSSSGLRSNPMTLAIKGMDVKVLPRPALVPEVKKPAVPPPPVRK